MKHTPGPWKKCTGSHGDGCICGLVWSEANDRCVAAVRVETCPLDDHSMQAPLTDESKANANLIAAAPALLAICQEIADNKIDLVDSERRMRLYHAICKATGGEL